MKRLLFILILTFNFQSFAKADDIRDFEIEGMSIGDRLTDYFEKEIIEWNNKLKTMSDVLEERAKCQSQWMYL